MMIESKIQSGLEYGKFKLKKPKSVVDGYFSKISYGGDKYTIDTPYVKIKQITFIPNSSTVVFKITEETRDFFQSIYDIEEFLLLNVEKNSEKWFNKKLTVDVLYKNQIKPWNIDRNGDILLEVNIRNNREFRKIQNGDFLSLTLHLEGIQFNSKTFGSSWKCIDYKSFDENCNLFQNIDEDNLFSISRDEPDNLKDNLIDENIVNENIIHEEDNGNNGNEKKLEINEEENINERNVEMINNEDVENNVEMINNEDVENNIEMADDNGVEDNSKEQEKLLKDGEKFINESKKIIDAYK